MSYAPIYSFFEKCTLNTVTIFLKNVGNEFYDLYVDMLIFDALIYNTDRHFGNFGLLVDNMSNKPISFAPIFDNGLSLFNYAMDEDIENLEQYSKTRLPAYNGVTYEEIVKQFISERQKSQLRKMINFKFKKHPRYNLTQKRLIKIENFLQKRIHELLEL